MMAVIAKWLVNHCVIILMKSESDACLMKRSKDTVLNVRISLAINVGCHF